MLKDRFSGIIEFDHYDFKQLNNIGRQLGIVFDDSSWVRFILDIKRTRSVLDTINLSLKHRRKNINFSNQFTILECWYNVARLYSVRGGLSNNESYSPDDFIDRLEQFAFDVEIPGYVKDPIYLKSFDFNRR